jgi:predicted secreted protein
MPHLPRLILETTVLAGVYLLMLFYVMGQKAVYWDLLRGLKGSSSVEEKSLSPA